MPGPATRGRLRPRFLPEVRTPEEGMSGPVARGRLRPCSLPEVRTPKEGMSGIMHNF